MTDKVAPTGWVIQPSSPQSEEKPSFKFQRCTTDADAAVALVRKQAGASERDRVYAVRPLTAGELATIKLKAGEAKPA